MKIYVGNLDYSVTSTDLQAMFEAYGEVAEAEVQVKRRTGLSRGFGLVDMPDDDAARTAIEALNGTDQNGRELKVNESRPRRTARDLYTGGWFGGGGGGGYGGGGGGYGGGGGGYGGGGGGGGYGRR